MKNASEQNSFSCDAKTYWDTFWDDAYLRALFLDGLGFRDFSVLEKTDTNRKLRIVPAMNLPGPVAKILGDSFAYEEHGTLDREKNVWRWKMVPGKAMQGKLFTEGTIRITPEGERVRRTDEVSIEAKVFGVGGLIEASAEKELRAAWSKEATFLRRWLEKKASP